MSIFSGWVATPPRRDSVDCTLVLPLRSVLQVRYSIDAESVGDLLDQGPILSSRTKQLPSRLISPE